MRRALTGNPYQSTKHGDKGYGYFGKHAGYDYAVKEWAVKSPEAGTILRTKIAPNADGGNIVELRSSKYDHRFLHLKSIAVKNGQKVKEGQTLGVSGNTGNVGYHLHHDTRKKGTLWTDSYSNYVDWERILKQGEDDMFMGKTAKKHWEIKEVWKKRAEDRAKEITSLKKQLAEAKKQLATQTSYKEIWRERYQKITKPARDGYEQFKKYFK